MKYAILSFKRSLKKRHIHVAIIREFRTYGVVTVQQVRFNKDGQRRLYYYCPDPFKNMRAARKGLKFEAEAKHTDIRFYTRHKCST